MKVRMRAILDVNGDLAYTEAGKAVWKGGFYIRSRERGGKGIWVEAVATGELAERLAEMELKKGTKLDLEGGLYADKSGLVLFLDRAEVGGG